MVVFLWELLERKRGNVDSAYWISKFEEVGALWEHGGNPKQPHVCLTSGQHAGEYTNASLFTQTHHLEHALVDLLGIGSIRNVLEDVEHVTGPANGATRMVSVTKDISHRTALPSWVRFSCPKREGDGESKRFVPDEEFGEIGEDTRVLLVDDVLTTGSSLRLLMEAIEKRGGIVRPVLITLVNQSGQDYWEGCQIASLFKREIETYPAHDCPLCKMGSEAIRPKEGNNWKRLTVPY